VSVTVGGSGGFTPVLITPTLATPVMGAMGFLLHAENIRMQNASKTTISFFILSSSGLYFILKWQRTYTTDFFGISILEILYHLF